MQRIRFGLDLDGERGWHTRDALGESTVGPLGLLTLLETQLGLTRSELSRTERIVQLRQCLQELQNGERFYEKSFQADEFGTASTLLHWRDLWNEHGWSGEVGATASARLSDMAQLELVARATVFPGLGERLRDIHDALQDRQPQIAQIELVDPLSELPLRWRQVLACLTATLKIASAETPHGKTGSLLNELQHAFLRMSTGESVERLAWREDGSVRIVRAETRLASAQWLAADASSRHDRVIIAELAGATLDAALAANDQPLLGLTESSPFRPALQLVPLVARLLWAPLDFRALLQFLTLPVGPLRPFARRRLAEKMAATPGIGGPEWTKVLGEIAEHYGDAADEVLADIAFWLEGPRFAPAEQAPLSYLKARLERLSALFRRSAANDDPVQRAAAVTALQQVTALGVSVSALLTQGVTRIAPEALDRLIRQSCAAGVDNPQLKAQAGASHRVRAPGAVIDTFHDVCWWNLVAGPLPQTYPWSPRELEQLRAMNVDLPGIGHLLERQVRGWVAAVLQARERLTLLLPGAGEEVHPAWLMLSSLLREPRIHAVEDVLTVDAGAYDQAITNVPHRRLPGLRRWWKVPAGSIHAWERSASYSSLHQFFNNPYQWALNYPAQLKASALLDLPNPWQLLGNLAHRTVERLYRDPTAIAWPEARVRDWFEQACSEIVLEEGAVLLMRGRRADLESFRLRFRHSLLVLHRLLQAAGAISVEPEKALEADTPLGTLKGSSDLFVTFAGGRRAVIDMKWGRNAKYRNQLADEAYTQLAIYARLVERNTSDWPAVAYFILSQTELLTTAQELFPGVTPVRSAGTSTALLWERITTTWRWRREQIEAGRLEVVLEATDATSDSAPPDGALEIELLDERYNPFLPLAGWGPDA